MKEQRKFISWIKAHKKALIIAGISIGTLIAIALGIKNREAIMEVWASLRKIVEKPAEKVLKAPVVEKVAEVAPAIGASPVADQILGEVTPVVEECAAEIGRQGYTAPFDVSRHKLVSPDILGVSSGCCVGAGIAILLGMSAGMIRILAFAFGFGAVVCACKIQILTFDLVCLRL